MLIKRTALLGRAGRFFLRMPVASIALRHVSQELVDLVLSQWGIPAPPEKMKSLNATDLTLAEAGRRVR